MLKVRVIGCDFDSYLSQWGGSCPTQSFEHQSLEERSEDMLNKLQAAGVGQRPTVFVGHSMGGLIIKKMLVNAQNSDDEERKKFAENTKGVVFYSTPHKGSEIANLNMITKYFFSPSVEVQELNTDYPLLLELNNCFKGFVEKFKTKVIRKSRVKLDPLRQGICNLFLFSHSCRMRKIPIEIRYALKFLLDFKI